jgi:hypothetical protein
MMVIGCRFRSKMMRHLKSLIFDCLSFTEGLITWLFSTDKEAPAFNKWSTTSVLPLSAAQWMQKMKYQMFRVASCFNRVIVLNQKM